VNAGPPPREIREFVAAVRGGRVEGLREGGRERGMEGGREGELWV